MDRIAMIAEAARPAVNEMLRSMRGANAFGSGARVETRQVGPDDTKACLVLHANNGAQYTITIAREDAP
jgi:hypothetical protein